MGGIEYFEGPDSLADAAAFCLFEHSDLAIVRNVGLSDSAQLALAQLVDVDDINARTIQFQEIWYDQVPQMQEVDRVVEEWSEEYVVQHSDEIRVSSIPEGPVSMRSGGTSLHPDVENFVEAGFTYGPFVLSYGLDIPAIVGSHRLPKEFTTAEIVSSQARSDLIFLLESLQDDSGNIDPTSVVSNIGVQRGDDIVIYPALPEPSLHFIDVRLPNREVDRHALVFSYILHAPDVPFSTLRENWLQQRVNEGRQLL